MEGKDEKNGWGKGKWNLKNLSEINFFSDGTFGRNGTIAHNIVYCSQKWWWGSRQWLWSKALAGPFSSRISSVSEEWKSSVCSLHQSSESYVFQLLSPSPLPHNMRLNFSSVPRAPTTMSHYAAGKHSLSQDITHFLNLYFVVKIVYNLNICPRAPSGRK